MNPSQPSMMRPNTRGFILLFAVLTVSFVLAVTFSLADSIRKQHQFVSFGSESLLALNQSDAGLECALYWDRKQDAFSKNPSKPITCMDKTNYQVSRVDNKYTFTLTQGSQSTQVIVDKSLTGTTTIETTGYNISTGGTPQQVSRSLFSSYADNTTLAACKAFDVALTLDISNSLNLREQNQLKTAAQSMIDGLTLSPTAGRFGVSAFDHEVFGATPVFVSDGVRTGTFGPLPTLSSDATVVKNAIAYATDVIPKGITGTNLPGGMIKGKLDIEANARPGVPKFLMIITDGVPKNCADANGDWAYCNPLTHKDLLRTASEIQTEAESIAIQALDIKIIIVGIGVGEDEDPPPTHNPNFPPTVDMTADEWMREFVASPSMYYPIDSFDDLDDQLGIFNCSYFARTAGTPSTRER